MFGVVRPAAHGFNGYKSPIRPAVGRMPIQEVFVFLVRIRYTNSKAEIACSQQEET